MENPVDEKWDGRPEEGKINRKRAEELIAKFDTEEKADRALEALKAYWSQLLSHFTLISSEEKLDRMVNIWNQYQCMVTFNMSRSASYFESGIGRGMGFRLYVYLLICLALSIWFGQSAGETFRYRSHPV